MSGIQFGELPNDGRRPGAEWVRVASALRARPGEWALVKTAANSKRASYFANAIGHGRLSAFSTGGFEAVIRGCDVWARYVGSAS
jgi:hypothetical protein